jgi:putative transposase
LTSIGLTNQLHGQFAYDAPDEAWVIDITYIRTHEGCFTWLSLLIFTHAQWFAGAYKLK